MTFNELNRLMDETVSYGCFQPVVLAMNGFEVCRGYISAWECSAEEPNRQPWGFGGKYCFAAGHCKQRIKIEIKTMDGNTCVLYVEEVIDSNDTDQVKELEESFKRLNDAVADYKKHFVGE